MKALEKMSHWCIYLSIILDSFVLISKFAAIYILTIYTLNHGKLNTAEVNALFFMVEGIYCREFTNELAIQKLLTDLLTRPWESPAGGAAETAETGGAAAACDGGTFCGAYAPALCGASCGVVLWACCNPLE